MLWEVGGAWGEAGGVGTVPCIINKRKFPKMSCGAIKHLFI